MEILTPDTLLNRSPELLASAVDDELVMMDINAGQYYGMNAVATRIWELLETPQSIRSICDRLLKQFDVEPAVCEQEVVTFLTELLEKKVVQMVESETVPA